MPFVLDASVVMAWFLQENAAESEPWGARLAVDSAVVPALWWFEVANGLLVSERRGRATMEQVQQFLADLPTLPVREDEHARPAAVAQALSVAREHGLTAYDAAYLELASRAGLPLATLDQVLIAAARATGVQVDAG